MTIEEMIQRTIDDLRCSTCIHFEACIKFVSGGDLYLIGADCQQYKPIEETKSCDGCCNLAFRYSMYPCTCCVRAHQKDYYKVPVED